MMLFGYVFVEGVCVEWQSYDLSLGTSESAYGTYGAQSNNNDAASYREELADRLVLNGRQSLM